MLLSSFSSHSMHTQAQVYMTMIMKMILSANLHTYVQPNSFKVQIKE